MNGTVYLIPSFLHEQAPHTIPPYVLDCIKECSVFFVENERSARRYLKKLWPQMNIDSYRWFTIHKAEESVLEAFSGLLKEGLTLGIISEAGCPGVADPGQLLVERAQKLGGCVKPLVGPSSILLALMASGMNGQQFRFRGYLPIDAAERKTAIREMENESEKSQCTQIFIETPYRNNQLLKQLTDAGRPGTRLCMAIDVTAPTEQITTKTLAEWRKNPPDINKRLAIFLLHVNH